MRPRSAATRATSGGALVAAMRSQRQPKASSANCTSGDAAPEAPVARNACDAQTGVSRKVVANSAAAKPAHTTVPDC